MGVLLKKSHELIAKLFKRVPSLTTELMQPFGIGEKTIGAWARPRSHKEDIHATGKGNPIDRVEKLFDEAHPYDPEMVREIAEHFSLYADELDRRAGLYAGEDEDESCFIALRKVANAYHRLVMCGLGSSEDTLNRKDVYDKTEALKTYVLQLEGCLRRNLQISEGENENA